MKRILDEVEEDLDGLQMAYINEDDEVMQLEIVRKFSALLQEATEIDGVDRISAGVNITNWTKENT